MFKRARHQFSWLEKTKGNEVPSFGSGVTTRMFAAMREPSPRSSSEMYRNIRRNERHGKLLRAFDWQSVIQSTRL